MVLSWTEDTSKKLPDVLSHLDTIKGGGSKIRGKLQNARTVYGVQGPIKSKRRE